jgi:hypothetical protein
VADAAPAAGLVVGVGAGHLRGEAVEQVEDAGGLAAVDGAGQADDLLRRLGQVVHGVALVAVDALVLVFQYQPFCFDVGIELRVEPVVLDFHKGQPYQDEGL